MSKPSVLCLGEVLFDCLADQLGLKLEEVKSWTPYPGGAPANVACALVKLGTSAGFMGAVGEDEPGNKLVKLLQDVGVDFCDSQIVTFFRHMCVTSYCDVIIVKISARHVAEIYHLNAEI